jgi:hypothetical protein
MTQPVQLCPLAELAVYHLEAGRASIRCTKHGYWLDITHGNGVGEHHQMPIYAVNELIKAGHITLDSIVKENR